MVDAAVAQRRRPGALGPLRHRAGLHAAVVLRPAVQLPDAVLLAVRLDRLRRAGRALRPLPPGLADPALREPDAPVPAAVPADLLLLPQGLLPVVLALAAGLRRRGAAPSVPGGVARPAAGPEPAPPLLL